MKVLITISRIIVGLAFMFSGFVKGIDPLGSAYKFQDYFAAFDIGFLKSFSLALSILLCTVEFIAGFSVLTGIRIKTGITVVLLLMIIFTPLTFILALTNPVSDCGCFGDAVKLTNWQTFGKNIILITFAIVLFNNRNRIKQEGKKEWFVITGISLSFIFFCFYNLRYLPVIDFLPYKEGVRIADKMVVPEGASPDRYETTFIYEKDGVQKEFTLNNYPADDTTWKFIDQKSVLVEKGYEPPIHDFAITTNEGEDITARVLGEPGVTVFMIAKKLGEAKEKHLTEGFEYGEECLNNGINFYVLTASGGDETGAYENVLQFCTMDETTLKTMVRSNPGYILLQNGVILKKWSWANLPEKEEVITMIEK